MDPQNRKIAERLAVIETRCESLPDMRRDLAEIRKDLANLKVRVAGVAATVSVLVTVAVEIATRLVK